MIIQVQISRAEQGNQQPVIMTQLLVIKKLHRVKAMMADGKRILSIINYISVIGQRFPYILVAQQ